MKKMKPWMWIALVVGGILILRRTGFASKPKDILEIEKGKVTFTVPEIVL